MLAITMQRFGVNAFFFAATSCFIGVPTGRLFFHLVYYSLPCPGSPITNCSPSWSCSLKCPFSSLWHTFSAPLHGSDIFSFLKGASCWVVFRIWHSSCIKTLLWQLREKECCSPDSSSVSSWWCLELPFCCLKFFTASGLHRCSAGTAV